MSKILKAHLALLGMTLIFGAHYTVAKGMMPGYLEPLQLLFLRLLGGTALFWAFQGFFVKEKIERKDYIRLALAGLTGFTLNQGLFYMGLNLTYPLDASLIHVLNPVFVLILAGFFIGEKVTKVKVGGIALGTAGALLMIVYGKIEQIGDSTFVGNVLVFLNMFFYATYLIMIKPLVAKYNSMTILKWVSLFGALFTLPFSIPSLLHLDFSTFTVSSTLSLLYIIIFCTFLAYLLINYALKQVNASAVSYYTYLQPVIVAIMSLSLGHDTFSGHKIIAAVLIFAGVYFVNRPDGRKDELEKMPERQ